MVLRPDNFTEQAQQVIRESQEMVRRYRHGQWDAEHILMALLEQEQGVPPDLLAELGVPRDAMRARLHAILDGASKLARESNQVFMTPRAEGTLTRAKAEADRLGDDFISSEHLLIALTQEQQGPVAQVLKEYGVETERVYQALQTVRGSHRVTDQRAESRYRSLDRFSIDLTQLARDGRLDPVIGREVEVSPRDADAHPPHQEQPRPHRRSRSRQDGHSRGTRAVHCHRQRATGTARPQRPRARHGGHGCGAKFRGRVRGASEGRHGRDQAGRRRDHPVH